MTYNLDHNTAIQLDTLFVTLDNFVSYRDGITRLEFGILLFSSKSLLSNFN